MRKIIAGAFALTVVLSAPAHLEGQDNGTYPQRVAPRFDYFISTVGPALGGSRESSEGAVGGRLMWSLGDARDGRRDWLDRASLGGGVRRSVSDGRDNVWRYGVESDYQLTSSPIGGLLDPFLTVSVGARRMNAVGGRTLLPAWSPDLSPLGREEVNGFIAPGVGVRLRLADRVGALASAREVWDFDGRSRAKFELSAGLSFGS